MSDNNAEKFVEFLIRTPRGLDWLLQSSPFEQQRNRLDEDIFFDNLFYGESKVFRRYIDELKNLLSGGGKIVSFEGHSGVGKTTFIRKFMRDHERTFNFRYIDCSKFAGNVLKTELTQLDIKHANILIERAQSPEERAQFEGHRDRIASEIAKSERENSLTLIFRKYIKSIDLTESDRSSFLYFLSRNRDILADYLSSNEVKAQLADLSEREGNTQREAEAWANILDKLETRDSFVLLLTLLEFLRNKNLETGVPEVIIFDNLDAVPKFLLHKDFIQLFYDTQNAFGDMCDRITQRSRGIKFSADQNFVFVIRDANNSSIAEHWYIRFGIERIQFSCDPSFYRNIIAKRLNYYLEKVELPVGRDAVARKIIALFNFLAEQSFYTTVLIPAFNMDHRRLSKALYEVLENFIPDVDPATAPLQRMDWSGVLDIKFPELPSKSISPFSIHGDLPKTYFSYRAEVPAEELSGFYGALMHGVIARLHSVEFYRAEHWSRDEGYCLASRMLLTLILNSSGFGESREFIVKNNRYEEVPLDYILMRTQRLYSKSEVLKTLVRLYLVEDNGQATYLVSFRLKEIRGRHEQEDLEKLLRDSAEWDKLIEYASVVITQAGFVFLRNLIVHYEFYAYLVYNAPKRENPGPDSMFANDRRASYSSRSDRDEHKREPKPLFLYAGKRLDDGEGQYDFDESLLATFGLVKNHSEKMQKFYISKFKNQGTQDYLSSSFVFKHTGGIAWREGLFHITRIVAEHVKYIDEYRLWLLKRSSTPDVNAKRALNNKLLKYIEDYVNLLTLWGDKDSKMEEYEESVRKNIQTIKDDPNNWGLAVAPMKVE